MPSAWHLWLLPWLCFVNKNDTDRKASPHWVRFKDSSIEEPRSGSYRDVLSAHGELPDSKGSKRKQVAPGSRSLLAEVFKW